MRIDLHAHTTCSDGTQSPTELVAAARAAALDVVAITDHDTLTGWAEAGAAAIEHGIALVPGVEISCERGGRSVHLLGYLVDPAYDPLAAELAKVKWPTRKEVSNSTVIVIATGAIATLYLALLDRLWSFVTDLFYGTGS